MRATVLALAWLSIASLSLASLSSPPQGGITYTPVLDNETVEVARFHAPPSTSELLQTWTEPALFVLLTPGDVDLTVGNDNGRGDYDAGTVTFVPAGVFHLAKNVGATTFDLLLIKLKSTRPKAPAAPATDAPPGITRIPTIS
jgi:quercetin dioxygenase-like cupin family protein